MSGLLRSLLGTGTGTQVTEFTPMYVPHTKPPYGDDNRLLIVMETKYTNYWYVLQLLHGIIDALHDLLTARYAGISTSDPKYNAEIRGLAALINGEGGKDLPTHTKLASKMSVDALKKLLDITTTEPTDETNGIIWMIMRDLFPSSDSYAIAVPKLPKVHKALISHAHASLGSANTNRPREVNVITVYNIAGIILDQENKYNKLAERVLSHKNIGQEAGDTTDSGKFVPDCGPGGLHRAMTAETTRDMSGNLTISLTNQGTPTQPTSGTIDSSSSSGATMKGAEWCVPFIFIYSKNSDADNKHFKLPSAVIMIYVKGTGKTKAIISFKYFKINLQGSKTLQSEMETINSDCYDNPPQPPALTRPDFDSNEWSTNIIEDAPPLSDVITFIQGGNSWIKDFFLKSL